jgi:hypothetical protein
MIAMRLTLPGGRVPCYRAIAARPGSGLRADTTIPTNVSLWYPPRSASRAAASQCR